MCRKGFGPVNTSNTCQIVGQARVNTRNPHLQADPCQAGAVFRVQMWGGGSVPSGGGVVFRSVGINLIKVWVEE